MAKIFISYSSKDRERVQEFVWVFEPSEYDVWWDRELLPHQDFEEVLLDRVDESCAVIVVWTENSIESDWVAREVDRASGKLISIRMDDCLPKSPYDNKHIEDMTSREGWKYARAIMKVRQSIKFLCESDHLIAEPSAEQVIANQRQLEQLEQVLAASEPKDDAPSARPGERERAAVRAVMAEEELAEAFAKGDYRGSLQTVIGRRQAEAKADAQQLRDIGALAYDRDPQTALEAYREATKLDGSDFGAWIYLTRLEQTHGGSITAAKEAAIKARTIAASERDQSVAMDELGDIAMLAGELVAARTAFTESLEIRRQLAEANPESAHAQRDVSVSLERLGDVAAQAGDLDAARTAFTESLETRRQLAGANPESAEAQRDASVSLVKLGDVAVEAGDLVAARTAFTESLETVRTLAGANPASAEAQRDVSVSLSRLGEVAVEAGDLVEARAAFTESLETARTLAEANPASAEAQRDLWVSMWRLVEYFDEYESWQDVADAMQVMKDAGTLFRADEKYLDQAKANAAAQD